MTSGRRLTHGAALQDTWQASYGRVLSERDDSDLDLMRFKLAVMF